MRAVCVLGVLWLLLWYAILASPPSWFGGLAGLGV